jgi:16S rRNA C967 or C1407 C5-methylase (RsmB/RsmF family)
MDTLPTDFVATLEDHFNREVVGAVLRGLDEPPSISVRLNQNKPSDRFNTERRVPWSDRGRLLEKRLSFSLDPLLHAGAYYVQDSSSMIIEYLLNQLSFDGGGLLALDLCAAPGGKSIILSDFLEDRGYLIANEVDQKRNAVLTENLLKWGSAHHAITQLSASKLGEFESVFDLVLIDAPCSGEGMFRKDAFALEQWNLDLVAHCTNTQSQILNDIDSAIRPGGYVVYSTCTMNVQENERQVKHMLELGYELVAIDTSEFAHYLIPAVYENENLGWYLLFLCLGKSQKRHFLLLEEDFNYWNLNLKWKFQRASSIISGQKRKCSMVHWIALVC